MEDVTLTVLAKQFFFGASRSGFRLFFTQFVYPQRVPIFRADRAGCCISRSKGSPSRVRHALSMGLTDRPPVSRLAPCEPRPCDRFNDHRFGRREPSRYRFVFACPHRRGLPCQAKPPSTRRLSNIATFSPTARILFFFPTPQQSSGEFWISDCGIRIADFSEEEGTETEKRSWVTIRRGTCRKSSERFVGLFCETVTVPNESFVVSICETFTVPREGFVVSICGTVATACISAGPTTHHGE